VRISIQYNVENKIGADGVKLLVDSLTGNDKTALSTFNISRISSSFSHDVLLFLTFESPFFLFGNSCFYIFRE